MNLARLILPTEVSHLTFSYLDGLQTPVESTFLSPSWPHELLKRLQQSFPMSSSTIFRIASKSPSACLIRAAQPTSRRLPPSQHLTTSFYAPKRSSQCFSTTSRSLSSPHGEETFDEFNARYPLFSLYSPLAWDWRKLECLPPVSHWSY